jgi:hypothetical protein
MRTANIDQAALLDQYRALAAQRKMENDAKASEATPKQIADLERQMRLHRLDAVQPFARVAVWMHRIPNLRPIGLDRAGQQASEPLASEDDILAFYEDAGMGAGVGLLAGPTWDGHRSLFVMEGSELAFRAFWEAYGTVTRKEPRLEGDWAATGRERPGEEPRPTGEYRETRESLSPGDHYRLLWTPTAQRLGVRSEPLNPGVGRRMYAEAHAIPDRAGYWVWMVGPNDKGKLPKPRGGMIADGVRILAEGEPFAWAARRGGAVLHAVSVGRDPLSESSPVPEWIMARFVGNPLSRAVAKLKRLEAPVTPPADDLLDGTYDDLPFDPDIDVSIH